MLPLDFSRDKSDIVITCPQGLSEFVRSEMEETHVLVKGVFQTGVRTYGTVRDCIFLNLSLSTAHHVLYQVLDNECATADDLYAAVSSLPWESLIPRDTTLAVTSTVSTPSITDSRFANLRCKDAIVDRLVAKTGCWCDSGPRKTGAVIHVHWRDRRCRVYIDTSGEPLSRRGYRLLPGSAPMQETLAAAVVRATRWKGIANFINPMCGSGTLAIEAALIAMNRKPGTLRTNFAFMHLIPFSQKDFIDIRDNLKASECLPPKSRIVATDFDADAVRRSRENAKAAGVDSMIDFDRCEFDATTLPRGGGVVVLNPEYGFRMGDVSRLALVYAKIGAFLKRRCVGCTGYVFSGNFDLVKKIGLKSSRKIPFYNGKIPCRLYEYELYTGTRMAGQASEPIVEPLGPF